jgi:hypothetical protein
VGIVISLFVDGEKCEKLLSAAIGILMMGNKLELGNPLTASLASASSYAGVGVIYGLPRRHLRHVALSNKIIKILFN